MGNPSAVVPAPSVGGASGCADPGSGPGFRPASETAARRIDPMLDSVASLASPLSSVIEPGNNGKDMELADGESRARLKATIDLDRHVCDLRLRVLSFFVHNFDGLLL